MKIMINEYKEVLVPVPTFLVANRYAKHYKPKLEEMILVLSVVYQVPMMKILEPPDVVVVE